MQKASWLRWHFTRPPWLHWRPDASFIRYRSSLLLSLLRCCTHDGGQPGFEPHHAIYLSYDQHSIDGSERSARGGVRWPGDGLPGGRTKGRMGTMPVRPSGYDLRIRIERVSIVLLGAGTSSLVRPVPSRTSPSSHAAPPAPLPETHTRINFSYLLLYPDFIDEDLNREWRRESGGVPLVTACTKASGAC